MTVRKPSGRKQRRALGDHLGPIITDPNEHKILGITVHKTDRLQTDLRLRHPIVRVSAVDLDTTNFVRKTDPERKVLSYHIIDEPLSDYIMPINSQRYDFNENRSTIPSWDELLIFNEEYSHFIKADRPKVMLFFEILEFVTGPASLDATGTTYFPIAWAFLKIVGTGNALNTEHTLRLQLWEPSFIHSTNPHTPDVYMAYSQTHRRKYPSTLYVTVKSIVPPKYFRPKLRSAIAGDIEDIREEYMTLRNDIEGQLNTNFQNPSENAQPVDISVGGPLQRVAQLPQRWQKLPNSKCKIPLESLLSLKGSERGCSTIRFSHNGYFIACAEVSKPQDNNFITIYELPRGQRVTIFSGHLQLIYHIDWSRSDRWLASASADSSVKIWNFENIQRKPWRTLSHPNYVYCVQFHPYIEEVVVTAGYDKLIRIWDIQKKHGTVRIILHLLNLFHSLKLYMVLEKYESN
ncbi:unnamed protein product [Didymodactylos carnosus]|uniref:Uncharacterized protein n=1 Tax=Didymodactylos carnosus TaxID=1234261 RepID=A0A8S2PZW1_9BILA|nr:unnamed protein product [Didymodactylos carnosus]CAF4079571.1 unnamed protein product [Didymodactylos carnosus]